ncbi:MAG: YceI family protein [Saprospiraceae bacterium]
MKNYKMFAAISLLLLSQVSMSGQVKFMTATANSMVSGTSTLHDWEMKSSKADCSATLTLDGNGNLTGISAMKFKIGVKTLKSGKGSMDNNAYKALKTDKNPYIIADLKNAKVTTKDNVNYTVTATILLNIAGKTRETDMTATLKKINVDSYSVVAKKKLSMSDYNVEPPSFMMGAVTTGNDVELSFNFIFNK